MKMASRTTASPVEGGARQKIGIMLVNTGTPDDPTPEAVRSYLHDFLSDDRIACVNPIVWKFILNAFILPTRSKRSAAKYEGVWLDEGSPLLVHSSRLVEKLQRRLTAGGYDLSVRLGMSFGNPNVSAVLGQFADEGFDRVIVIPMYPQPAYSTCKVVSDAVARFAEASGWRGEVELVEGYWEEPLYIRAIADSVRNRGFDAARGDRLLFSYHSIPMQDVVAGDDYGVSTRKTSELVARALGIDRSAWDCGYQCRFDKSRSWMSPFSKGILAHLGQGGAGRVFLVCPNFSIDCLETLHDVAHELSPAFEEAGGEELVYVPCLNADDIHVELFYSIVARRL